MNTKQLRQTILDLAIRGELVPQDPSDEPASVLLERIRAEKEQLIKDKKLKRDKKDNEPIDEVPFELPEGWEWCRLGEICEIKGGKRLPKNSSFSDTPTNHIYIRVADMKNSTVLLEDLKYIDDEVFEKIKNYLISKEDLYLTIAGTIGEVGIIPNNLDGMNLTENAAKLTEIKISRLFLMYCLSSNFCRQQFFSGFHQVAQPKLSLETANKTQLPLPPLAEQHCIVKKIEQLLALVDAIEQLQEELKALVKQAKNQVLNYAIAGKLTHQDPNDEPAEELLKRIGKTTAADTPYEKLPKGWAWCRLGDIGTINPKNKLNDELDVSFIPMPLISDAFSNVHTSEVKKWGNIKKGYTHFCNEDIGIAKITPCFENRKSVIFNNLKNGVGAGTTELYILRNNKTLSFNKYIFWFIKTQEFINNGIKAFTGAVGQQRISRDFIENTLIPLPPIAEQHRIVEKIESYFSFLDTIEIQINS